MCFNLAHIIIIITNSIDAMTFIDGYETFNLNFWKLRKYMGKQFLKSACIFYCLTLINKGGTF